MGGGSSDESVKISVSSRRPTKSTRSSRRSTRSSKSRASTASQPVTKKSKETDKYMRQANVHIKHLEYLLEKQKRRQKSIDCMKLLIVCFQVLQVVIVATIGLLVWKYLSTNIYNISYWSAGLFEVIVLAFAVAGMATDNSCVTFVVLLVYVLACFFDAFRLWGSTINYVGWECAQNSLDLNDRCIIDDKFPIKYHYIYLVAWLGVCHSLMLIISLFVYGCRTNTREKLENERRGLELTMKKMKETRKQKSRESSAADPLSDILPVNSMWPANARFVRNVTTVKKGIMETDEYGEKNMTTVSKTETVEDSVAHGDKVYITKTSRTQDATLDPKSGMASIRERPVVTEKSEIDVDENVRGKESKHKKEKKHRKEEEETGSKKSQRVTYNNISKMPALETPIAFLNRKEKEGMMEQIKMQNGSEYVE